MVNERLKMFRKKLGITQSELAKELGITLRTIQNYEMGKVEIPKTVALSLKALYNLNPNWLLTGEGSMFIEKEQIQDEKEKHIKELAEYLKTQDLEDIKQLKEFIKRWVLKTQTSSNR